MSKLYWLDLETTGLNPRQDRILEVAVSVADLSAPFDATPLYQEVLHFTPEGVSINPFVVKMHTDNGLWESCLQSPVTLSDVEAKLLYLIPAGTNYLAGNSIHFDLSFLRAWMPPVAALFSHRLYDVSAVNLFALSLGMPPLPENTAHRAQSDIEASIHRARSLADWFASR